MYLKSVCIFRHQNEMLLAHMNFPAEVVTVKHQPSSEQPAGSARNLKPKSKVQVRLNVKSSMRLLEQDLKV